jgi:16S rRNA (guanine966-N2)-methyltransferase
MPSKLGSIRIVGGQYKRTPLAVPDLPGLRPTPDRVRETLFNWLAGFTEGSRCLDLFAGTGALGLEAASRGAKEVVLVESSRLAAAQITDTLARLKHPDNVLLKTTSAETYVKQACLGNAKYDLVFLDPPFGEDWLVKLWSHLPMLLSDTGKVYVESEEPIDTLLQKMSIEPQWRIERAAKAGQVYYHLLSYITA